MEIITNEKLKQLAQINEPHCISIFIPTNRAGQEVNQQIDQKNLKMPEPASRLNAIFRY